MTVRSSGLKSIVQRLIDNLSQGAESTESVVVLIRQLKSQNVWAAQRALERLREQGALQDGTLREQNLSNMTLIDVDLSGINMGGANLQEIDLSACDLTEARLANAHMLGARLVGADLSRADLSSARLFRAELSNSSFREAFLFQVDLREVNLKGADLWGARCSATNLKGARVSLTQLVSVGMLNGSVMPDGSRYDGRFNLDGDFQFARFLDMEIDVSDSESMADFYEVSRMDYLRGQDWAQAYLHRLRAEAFH